MAGLSADPQVHAAEYASPRHDGPHALHGPAAPAFRFPGASEWLPDAPATVFNLVTPGKGTTTMPAYTTSNTQAGSQQAISTTHKTQVNLTAQTTGLTTASLVAFSVAADSAPADNLLDWDASRTT